MSQEEINNIISQNYSDKIQMCTLNRTSLDYLIYKVIDGGMKEFKGFSSKLNQDEILTVNQFSIYTDVVLLKNESWFNS